MTRKEAERKAQIIDFLGGYTIELVTNIYDDFENKSCDGCKYDEKDDSYPSICWECSRYYADKFEKIKSYCKEQKDTWESQENGNHKVYEKILKELNK